MIEILIHHQSLYSDQYILTALICGRCQAGLRISSCEYKNSCQILTLVTSMHKKQLLHGQTYHIGSQFQCDVQMQTSMHPYDIHQLFCILGITCKILCPLWHRKRSQNIVKQQVQMQVQNPGHVHFLEEAINGYEILVRLKIKSEFPFF